MLEPFSNPYPAMESRCSEYGGLIRSLVKDSTGNAWGGIYKTYKCYKSEMTIVKPTFETQPQNRTSELQQSNTRSPITNYSLDEIKAKCVEIGFKEATEALGICVLKLSK
jgi:hypothetical protein